MGHEILFIGKALQIRMDFFRSNWLNCHRKETREMASIQKTSLNAHPPGNSDGAVRHIDSVSGIKINAKNSRHMALVSSPLLLFIIINFSIGQQWRSTSVLFACEHFHLAFRCIYSTFCRLPLFHFNDHFEPKICGIQFAAETFAMVCRCHFGQENMSRHKKTQRLKWTFHLPTQIACKMRRFIWLASNRLAKFSIQFQQHSHDTEWWINWESGCITKTNSHYLIIVQL